MAGCFILIAILCVSATTSATLREISNGSSISHLFVASDEVVVINGHVTVSGDVTVHGGGVLTHNVTDQIEQTVQLLVGGTLTVETNGSINVDQKSSYVVNSSGFLSARPSQNVRLVGDPLTTFVRLDVNLGTSSGWGPVCDDGFSVTNAEIVCRELGYGGGSWRSQTGLTSTFLMDNVQCRGTESTIVSCPHITRDNCGSTETVFITCENTVQYEGAAYPSHGGYGWGNGSDPNSNPTYGDFREISTMGQKRNGNYIPGTTTSRFGRNGESYNGGGLVRITANNVVIEGSISARGYRGSSGGGIQISINGNGTVLGDGMIDAGVEWASGTLPSEYRGGGGRVSIFGARWISEKLVNTVNVNGAEYGSGAGTFYFELICRRGSLLVRADGYVQTASSVVLLSSADELDMIVVNESILVVDVRGIPSTLVVGVLAMSSNSSISASNGRIAVNDDNTSLVQVQLGLQCNPGESLAPTTSPSAFPTNQPTTTTPTTAMPSLLPTTSIPTRNPSTTPTKAPSVSPTTGMPTIVPSTAAPTMSPSLSPTDVPTSSTPTIVPSTTAPTMSPSLSPTDVPTSSTPTESPQCPSGQFETSGDTPTSSRICTDVTSCLSNEYESAPPTLTSDRNCLTVRGVCNSSYFERAPPSQTSDRICSLLRACSVTFEYETSPATATSNRQCGFLSPNCNPPGVYWESTAPTPTSDRQCLPVTQCLTNEVQIEPPSLSSDRLCRALTVTPSRTPPTSWPTATPTTILPTSNPIHMHSTSPIGLSSSQLPTQSGISTVTISTSIATTVVATTVMIGQTGTSQESSGDSGVPVWLYVIAVVLVMMTLVGAITIVRIRKQKVRKRMSSNRPSNGMATTTNPTFARSGPIFGGAGNQTRSIVDQVHRRGSEVLQKSPAYESPLPVIKSAVEYAAVDYGAAKSDVNARYDTTSTMSSDVELEDVYDNHAISFFSQSTTVEYAAVDDNAAKSEVNSTGARYDTTTTMSRDVKIEDAYDNHAISFHSQSNEYEKPVIRDAENRMPEKQVSNHIKDSYDNRAESFQSPSVKHGRLPAHSHRKAEEEFDGFYENAHSKNGASDSQLGIYDNMSFDGFGSEPQYDIAVPIGTRGRADTNSFA